jgi:hypothetical protein
MMARLVASRPLQIALLVLVAILFSAANWLKLGSFWMDAPRSLFEMYRFSKGEIPYRDFTFPYPPLAVFLCGFVLRLLGATFTVVQVTYGLLSVACVLAAWVLARRIAPPLPALLATITFTLVGATNGGNFAMFSIDLYAPAILIGAFGILLAAIGLVDTIRGGATLSSSALLICGGFIGCLGKPESAAGVLAGLFCFALINLRWPPAGVSRLRILGGVTRMAVLLLGPAIVVFAVLLSWLGRRPVLDGITAYGLASVACPYWPTGFGVVGGLAALGAAMASMGIVNFLFGGSRDVPSRRWEPLYVMAGIGALCWLIYIRVFFRDLTLQQPIRQGPVALGYLLVSANTFVLPLMWASVLMLALNAWSYLRAGIKPSSDQKTAFVILGIIAGVSTRELFNNTVSQATQATPMLYALIFPAFPMLIQHAFQCWNALRGGATRVLSAPRVYAAAAVVLCLFSGLRLAGYAAREARKHYRQVSTDAGAVKLDDDGVSEEVYMFLKSRTLPGEPIADLAYGGGVNFALHRGSPLFTTQFTNFRPTLQHRERDYNQLRPSGVRFVISRQPPSVRYGTENGCALPRLVWKPLACPDDAKTVFPVLQFVTDHYRPSKQFGDIVVYEKNPSGS